MKTIIKLSLGMFLALFISSCTKNFDKINENPNQPAEVATPYLLTAGMKGLSDDIYDEWWGGRQSLLYAQYWSQRIYTSEDRYAIRQNINNSYWRLIYHDIKNLTAIIDLNTNPETKVKASAYGDNNNQIAVATIMKIWAMQIMTDIYGDIPYSEAFQPLPNPKYDKQSTIYPAMLAELTSAIALIDETASGFISGDIVFGGDMAKWKKFGNSLRLRIGLRMSNVDNYETANAILAEVGEDGLMTSNADNAVFTYPGGGLLNSPLYDAYFTSKRNDFTTTKTLIDLLKGQDDTLNIKVNPFSGLTDPRLTIYSRPRNGKYIGMPYGMNESASNAYKANCATWYGVGAYSPATAIVLLNPRFAPVYLEFAEVKFMLSELKGFSQAEYIDGTRASMEYWRDICINLEGWDGTQISDYNTAMEAFLTAMPAASKTTVLTQKYLAFYNQGYQAWSEYRRTGEPAFLLQPGEIANEAADGTKTYFQPLITISTIPWRMTYPQQEYTVNAASVNAAAAGLAGGDKMTTKMWWEPAGK